MSSKYRGIGMTSQRTRDRLIQRLKEEGIANPAVLEVIRNTPRHLFVDEALASRAYDDTSLPIGHGQTISQPYVVARMTEALLRDGPLHKVLEIGTGSGYQAAVLAHVAADVRDDHSRLQHQPHAEAIDAHVVADGVQSGHAAADQRSDQVLRNAAKPEAAEHDGRAGGNIGDCFIGGVNDFIHPRGSLRGAIWEAAPRNTLLRAR